LKSYGPSTLKKRLWDAEFEGGKWNFIDDTRGDCVYGYLEKYGRQGSILDLGCGQGNTANELVDSAYRTYVGVDISEAALEKGRSGERYILGGDNLTIRELAERELALSEEHQLPQTLYLARHTLGWIAAVTGDERGIDAMREAIWDFRKLIVRKT